MKKNQVIKYAKNLLIVITICATAFYYFSSNALSKKYKISSANEKALSDTLRIIKDKYNNTVYEKNILIANEKDLKNINLTLYDRLNTFEKKDKKNIVSISILQGEINFLNDSIGKILSYNDSGYIRKNKIETFFDFSDKYKTLKGGTSINLNSKDSTFTYSSYLTDFSLSLDMTTGLKKNDEGNYEIYFKSNNPYFKISSIEGSIIDKKTFSNYNSKKKIGIGLQVGYGISKNGLSPYFGCGLSYNFCNF